MKTKVICLYGSSGVGKSTLSAGLFAEMKLRGIKCEYVNEHVKEWCWEGKAITAFDELYLIGMQSRKESILYGKVDYIIIDSPLYLYGYYSIKYMNTDIFSDTIKKYLNYIKQYDVEYINFFLNHDDNIKFDNAGRYETEEESKKNSIELKQYLKNNDVDFVEIMALNKERVNFVLNKLGI